MARYGWRYCARSRYGPPRVGHRFEVVWCAYCGRPPGTNAPCPYPRGHRWELICAGCGKPAPTRRRRSIGRGPLTSPSGVGVPVRPSTDAAPGGAPDIVRRARSGLAREFARCKTETVTCVSGAVAGIAPHLLHHAGPVAGTALVAGAGGQLLFGILGFLATLPLLWRLHRQKGGWRAPAWALSAFAVLFVLSTLVVGPFVADITQPDLPATPSSEEDPHRHDR